MGFQAVQRLGGGVPVVRYYEINGTAAIYKGEPLKICATGASGEVNHWTSKTTFNTGVAVGNLAGVAAEFYPGAALGSTKTKIAVWDPIQNIFQVKVGTGATASTTRSSYIFKNAQAATLTGGSTVTGLSNAYLSFASIGVSTNLAKMPVRIIDIARETDFDEYNSSYCHVLCQFVVGLPQIQNTSPA
jgi:hypothetical protein